MAISETIVIDAFEAMGGDPTTAIQSARNYSDVSSWVVSQAGQAAAAGAAAMAIPGVHVVAMVADVAFLLHKMAYCCWGIGEIRGCAVVGKSDFQNILALWSHAASIDELPHKAITKFALEEAVGTGGIMVGGLVAAEVISHLTGQQVAMYGGQLAGAMIGKKLGIKTGIKGGGKLGAKLAGKLGAKIAAKVGAKLSTKLGAKLAAGFIPFIGPAAGATVNAYFVKNIADSADLYYSHAI